MQRPARHGLRAFALASSLLPLINCIDTPDTDTDEAELNGSISNASTFQNQRAVTTPISGASVTCTGTRIASHWILTAGRCSFPAGSDVVYYGSTQPGGGQPFLHIAKVVEKIQPPGTAAPGDTTDYYGDYADIALVRVDREDQFGADAALAYRYPGSGAAGQKVGAGLTGDSDSPNTNGVLFQVGDTTSSSDDSDGQFKTSYRRWNAGDQGGPFYVNGRVLGVLDESSYLNARYTSVAHHLDWILETTSYRWSGSNPQGGGYNGTTLESFSSGYRPCEYACDSRSDCEAFTYTSSSSTCRLLSAVTGLGSAPTGSLSALHYAGPRVSRTGDVVGLVSGLDSWFHVTSAGNLKAVERTQGPAGMASTNIQAQANPPVVTGKLAAYKRADGVTSVLYRSIAKLIEVARTANGWQTFEMPTLSGHEIAGDPAAFVRADGVSSVVYRSWDNHLIELSLIGGVVPGGWLKKDLTATVPGAVLAASDPTAFVRADGFSSVIYRCLGTSICELFHNKDTHQWGFGEPLALAPNHASFPATGKPAGYVHHDGTTAIAYRTTANEIKELWLDGVGWHIGDIMGPTGQRGPAASGDPAPYVRTDGIEAVTYRSGNQIWELANWTFWQGANLTSWDGAPQALSDPMPFTRADGRDSVPYLTNGKTIGEMQLLNGATWKFFNLSVEALESP